MNSSSDVDNLQATNHIGEKPLPYCQQVHSIVFNRASLGLGSKPDVEVTSIVGNEMCPIIKCSGLRKKSTEARSEKKQMI